MKKLLVFCLCSLPMFGMAQPGISEMQQARQDLSSSFFSAFDCSLVLAGIIAIIGAVRVYHHWQMGKEQITAQISAWVFSIIFMILAGAFVRAIFGI